jgi:hypothetical protein
MPEHGLTENVGLRPGELRENSYLLLQCEI